MLLLACYTSSLSFNRCSDLKKKLKQNVTDAMDELMQNFDAEFGIGKHTGTHYPNKDSRNRDGGHGSDEEDSSCGSSFNHVRYLKCISPYLLYEDKWSTLTISLIKTHVDHSAV